MNLLKLILNAMVVTAIDFVSITVGFAAFNLSGSERQIPVQGSVGLVVGVGLIIAWVVLFRRLHRLADPDFIKVFLLAFPVSAVMFVPIHYLFTGYLTGFGNIVAGSIFQFPVNALGLVLGAALLRHKERAPAGALPSHRS